MKHQKSPPKWLDKLIAMICPEHLKEEVLGDLHERYALRAHDKTSSFRYFWEVMIYLKSTAFRRSQTHNKTSNLTTMIKHYFITGLRNALRNKVFSTINIMGLALGLTSFFLIFLWVQDELSIDSFHEHEDDLFALYMVTDTNGNIDGSHKIGEWVYFSGSSYFDQVWLDEMLKERLPEIEHISSYATTYELPWGYPNTFQYEDQKYKLNGASASGDFFKMFSFEIVWGDKVSPIDQVNTVAISEKMASMFFEKPQDAIGKTFRYENRIDLMVTAVFEDIGSKSSLQFDFVISYENQRKRNINTSDNRWPIYIQLVKGTDHVEFAKKLRAFNAEFKNPDFTDIYLGIQPFKDQYLMSGFVNGKPQKGRIEYLRIFSGVAIFILIIACINFTNLATSRALKRGKEIGVRKVIGSSKTSLITQFLSESLFLTLIATILSLVFIRLLLPGFNLFTGKQIVLPIQDGSAWGFLALILLGTAFFAGAYPAFFMSSLRPVRVLKGLVRFSSSSLWLKRGLTVFQFSLSILLLIGTLVVSKQTNYVQHTNLGYDKENIIYVRIEGTLNDKYQLLKNRLLGLPGIAMVDRSSEAPHDMTFEIAGPFAWEGMEEGTLLSFKPTSVGFDFLEMMNLQVVEGRGFSREVTSDTAAFMVNETALKQMNLENPIGKRISAWSKSGHIIGILKDYHTHSLREPIKPLIVDVKENLNFGIIMIKTQPGQTVQALESLEIASAEINPDFPLAYEFLDLEYAKLYQSETVISSLSNVFALLAIVISCLGLLGLAIFSAEQRIKEIGIRKVLGASIGNIVHLFSKDFLRLVGLSFLIAAPIAGYLMQEWLQNFAYKINLSWWMFALTGFAALAIAFLTVAYQTITAAKSNPVQNLRAE